VADAQIKCITKSDPNGGHEHIVAVGGNDWYWTKEQVIESIDAKTNTFHVRDPRTGKVAYVGVVRVSGHAAYIRTHADGIWTDNLLSLPACGPRK